MKNNVTLVMSGTANYSFAIANVLIGLEKHSPNFIDRVVIYHDGISQQDKSSLQKIRSCDFVLYEPKPLLKLQQHARILRFTLMSFAIYEIFQHLAHSKHVIYLDCDVLIQKDISGILNYGDVAMRPGGRPLEAALGAKVEGLTDDVRARNSGVVVVSDSIDYQDLTDLCYQKTIEYWDNLILPDQAILNLVFFLKKIPISLFPLEYNKNLEHPAHSNFITHQITKRKFWSHGIASFLAPEWGDNNKVWLNLGGTPYTGEKTLWEFEDLKKRSISKLTFMATAYRSMLQNTLNKFAQFFCESNNLTYYIKGYTFYIPIAEKPLSRFEVKVWADEISFKLYTKDLSRYKKIQHLNIIKNNLCHFIHEQDGTIYNFAYKANETAGGICYVTQLPAEGFVECHFSQYKSILLELMRSKDIFE